MKTANNTIFQFAGLIFWRKVKRVINCAPSAVKAHRIYNAALEVDAHNSAQAYMMAAKDLDTTKLLESMPPTIPTETRPNKKKPGPCNPDQVAEFVLETNKSLDHFLEKMHNYEPYAIEEAYNVLIAEYHYALCEIEEYFKNADKSVVLGLTDDKSCKVLRVETAKESENREKFPDPRTSTVIIITGTQALSRSAVMLNLTAIQGDQREVVCELFDSLQTAHTAIADVAATLATLGRTLDLNQFQFLLKHSVHPLVQLQVPAHLCHPSELKFAKEHLTDDELYEQCGVNTVLPRPHHLDLDQVPARHPTRALAGTIHYQLRKRMFTKFATSQTDVADLFQVKRKKFFKSITGQEYKAGKKQTKVEKIKMAGTADSKDKEKTQTPGQEEPQPTAKIDLEMPPLEDVTAPKKRLRFKAPDLIPWSKRFQKK